MGLIWCGRRTVLWTGNDMRGSRSPLSRLASISLGAFVAVVLSLGEMRLGVRYGRPSPILPTALIGPVHSEDEVSSVGRGTIDAM